MLTLKKNGSHKYSFVHTCTLNRHFLLKKYVRYSNITILQSKVIFENSAGTFYYEFNGKTFTYIFILFS